MKTKYIFLLSSILTTLGCNKYLDKNPDNRTEINSPEKVSLLLGTAYPKGNYIPMYEAASDNSGERGELITQTLLNTESFFGLKPTSTEQDSPEFFWTESYAAIAAANQALASINEAKNQTEYSAQKGEALVCRAYAHFMLVNTFAPVYVPGAANDSLAIPYVEQPENQVLQKYKRITVQQVYDKIEADLTEGIPLLDDNIYNRPKWHFTTAAANAFATRFFLFKKEYQKVIDYANASFPNSSIAGYMRPWNTTYLTYTATEQQVNYTKSDQNAILLEAETGSLWGRTVNGDRFGYNNSVSSKTVGLTAIGGGTWSMVNKSYYYGNNPDRKVVLKWNEYFVSSSINATIGQPYIMVPLFTAEEVLFNRAEAEAYLGQTTNALSDLNIYKSYHINNYSTNYQLTESAVNAYEYDNTLYPSTIPNLVKAVLMFKRVEFIQEGLRWLDIIRNKLSYSHTALVNGENVTTSFNSGTTSWHFSIPESANQGFEN